MLAVSCTDSADPAVTLVRVAPVVQLGMVAINHENWRSATAMDAVPVAVIVKVYDPADVGVPVNAPPLEREMPVGSEEPDFTA